MARRTTVNYLNNKELLEEIHISKNSFSWIKHEGDDRYDLILLSPEYLQEKDLEKNKDVIITNSPNDEQIKKAKENYFNNKSHSYSSKDEVPIEVLTFRVMTYEHIPERTEKKRNTTKASDKYEKLNFLPFKHYRYDQNGNILEEVMRSHWEGSLGNGHFSKMHGQLTNKLAKQIMQLIERYSKKSNWVGYSFLDQMKSGATLGLIEAALKFDERVSDNPFAYFTMCVTNCFRGVLNAEDKESKVKDKLLAESGMTPSFAGQEDE